jgi:hypothetical protein
MCEKIYYTTKILSYTSSLLKASHSSASTSQPAGAA